MLSVPSSELDNSTLLYNNNKTAAAAWQTSMNIHLNSDYFYTQRYMKLRVIVRIRISAMYSILQQSILPKCCLSGYRYNNKPFISNILIKLRKRQKKFYFYH